MMPESCVSTRHEAIDSRSGLRWCTSPASAPLGRSLKDWAIGRLSTRGRTDGVTGERAVVTAGPQEHYIAYLSLRGVTRLEQFGRTIVCGPHTLTLTSGDEPLGRSTRDDNDAICFAMPRRFIDQRLLGGERICAVPVGVEQGLGHVVDQSLVALEHNASTMTDDEFLGAARAVGELIVLLVGRCADLKIGMSVVRTGKLARAKHLVRARLSDPDLRLSDIASECGLSLRYLHKLFRHEGRTAREYLLTERLQKARFMLQHGSDATVTTVAMTCGFSNMSYFSTAFRAAFGICPRDAARGLAA